MRCESRRRSPFLGLRVSRNNLETVLAFALKLVPSLDSRNFLDHARPGQIDLDHRCDYHAGGTGDVERFRAEMARKIAGRYPDREGAFGILFSDRHLHHSQHCPEFAAVALLNVPALRSFQSPWDLKRCSHGPVARSDLAHYLTVCERLSGPWLQKLFKPNSINMCRRCCAAVAARV